MHRLLKWTLLLLILTVLAVASPALAEGKAVCRAEFGLETRLVCFAEQTVWSLGNLEVSAGAEYRTPNLITPYTFVGWFERDWWVGVEVAKGPVGQQAFGVSVSFGVRWK